VLEQILPAEVAVEEAFTDQPGGMLFPEEEAVVARAVGKRRREFTTGRVCAHAALARLGLPPVPIIPGEHGAPQWPAGVTGSITHCDGYRAAAVARVSDVLTLGLDAEPNQSLPDGVLGVVASSSERARLTGLTATGQAVCWDRLLFSAKEAVYKAWFPLAHQWLDFRQADVTIAPRGGTFTARLLVPGPPVDGTALRMLHGCWLATRGLVVTAVIVSARGR
jgi:4'-phosphopantetheinyl transferase EntD